LRAAHAVWQYADASARRIFGQQTGDPLLERFLELIQTEPGISRRDLRRRTSSSLSAERFGQALGDLLKSEIAHCVREDTQGTKKSERWYPGPKQTQRLGDGANGANATPPTRGNGTNGTGTNGTKEVRI
jgi:hypothetical protein